MPCLASLIIFSILGIFSVAYRRLAKESLDCLLRKISFRPCKADFQVKIKTKIVGFLSGKNPALGRFAYRRYHVLSSIASFIFILTFAVSGFYTIRSAYNYIIYDTCTPSNPEQCPLKKGETCIFSDEAVLGKLDLPAPKDDLTASIYKKLPTIVQRRILNISSRKLDSSEQENLNNLLQAGEALEIHEFLSEKVPEYKEIIENEMSRIKKEALETLEFEEK